MIYLLNQGEHKTHFGADLKTTVLQSAPVFRGAKGGPDPLQQKKKKNKPGETAIILHLQKSCEPVLLSPSPAPRKRWVSAPQPYL